MKRILLLGDSIREGYEPYVRERLAGPCRIVAPGRQALLVLYAVGRQSLDEGAGDA